MNKKIIILLIIGFARNTQGMDRIKNANHKFKIWKQEKLKKFNQTKLLKKMHQNKLLQRIQFNTLNDDKKQKLLEACDDIAFAQSALQRAIIYNRSDIADRIINKLAPTNYAIAKEGMLYNLRNNRDNSVLEIISRYEKHKADFKLAKESLYNSILQGNGQLVDKIMEWHLREAPNSAEPLYATVIEPEFGFTPFIAAVTTGQVEIMDKLLYAAQPNQFNKKKDNSKINKIINARDNRGNTPLMHAIKLIKHEPNAGLAVLDNLLRLRPHINIRNNNGDTVVSYIGEIQNNLVREYVASRLTGQLERIHSSTRRLLSKSDDIGNRSSSTYQLSQQTPECPPAA